MGDTVGLINSLGLVGCLVFVVQVGEGVEETGRDAVLLVKVDGTLSSLVTDNVTMREIFSNNTTSWLFFLSDLIAVSLLVVGVMASIILVGTGCTCNLDLSRAELCAVE